MQKSGPLNPMSFTFKGFWEALVIGFPVAFSVFSYGLVFGVLARQAGMSLLEAGLMSTIVMAGASQFTVLGLWIFPLPVVSIVLTTLVINLRHMLMGASIRPWLKNLKPLQQYSSLFFLSDESWALTMGMFSKGSSNGAFLLGSGFIIFIGWVGSTLVGHNLGSLFPEPATIGLDFAFTALFLALLTGLWKGKKDLLPWAVAAAVALITSLILPGKFYILFGGISGSLVGAWRDGDK